MAARMAKLDRILRLVHLLNETSEGLTLDEMADALSVDRRTAERLRDVVREHFDLEEWQDDRFKRFRIRDSLRRFFTRPDAVEVAALQEACEARAREGSPQAEPLARLLAKVKGALDDRERRRIEPDLDALARLQRTLLGPGPGVTIAPEVMATVQRCIMAGCCLEFDYRSEDGAEPKWRRVIPYGMVHGPTAYVVGQIPDRDMPPVFYRLDRMFARRFRQGDGTRRAYLLDGGSVLFLDPALQRALQVVREAQGGTAEQRRQFARSPQRRIAEALSAQGEDAAELGTLFVETQQFSERVSGIDIWRKPVLPWIKPKPDSWLPEAFGLRIGDPPDDQMVEMKVEEIAHAVDAVENALREERSTFTFGEAEI